MHKPISRRTFILDGLRGAAGSAMLPVLPRLRASPRVARSIPRGPDDFRQLESLIPELMGQSAVPGVSIAIIKDATVAWHRGFGVRDARSRAPVDQHTGFEAASVSKTVFADAALRLCDRGTLSLDRPLTAYTPERVLEGDPRLNLITARQILSHTSGFPNFRTRADPLRIHFTPGARFEYSGEGYWYLQSVVTHLVGAVDSGTCGSYEAGLRVCATDIDAYLKRNVLVPLRMSTSSYVWNDSLERYAAQPHDVAGQPLTRPPATDAAGRGRWRARRGQPRLPRSGHSSSGARAFTANHRAKRSARFWDGQSHERTPPTVPSATLNGLSHILPMG